MMRPIFNLSLLPFLFNLLNVSSGIRISNPSENGITIDIVENAPATYIPNQLQFILQLDTSGLSKRQARVSQRESYVCPQGTCTTCHFATIFTLVDDQLYTDGQLITTSTGAQYETLIGSSPTGNITNGFSLMGGVLQWQHPEFVSGTAVFCLSTFNTILIFFDVTQQPANCISIKLLYFPFTQCFPTISIHIGLSDGLHSQPASQLPGSTGPSIPQSQSGGYGSISPGASQASNSPYDWEGLPHSAPYNPQGSGPGAGTPGIPGSSDQPGPPGPSGSSGDTGPAGSDGSDGRNGSDGTDGRDGVDGTDGRDGTNGTNGTNGKDGATGATGSAGPPGPPGPAGAAGVNGTNGINGTNGATGPAGPAGSVGPAGPSGATGATGAAGRPGANGINGINGFNGINGINGTNGLNGTAGAAGPAGAAGTNGTSSSGNGTVYGTAYVHYSYIGCYVANPDGNFGIEPTVAQEILTTSVEDCATFCGDQAGNGTIYFTLGTDSQGNSICTCGNALSSYNYLSVGMDFHCNIPCNFTNATTTSSPTDFCGGQYGQDPLVSVFGAI